MIGQKRLVLKNQLSELELLALELENLEQEWLLEESVMFNLNLALEEIFTNIVFYGYTNKNIHEIFISFLKTPKVMEVKIEDDGVEFDPLTMPDPDSLDKSIEERTIGGLGIYFVKKLTDDVKYDRINNKNTLTFSIKL